MGVSLVLFSSSLGAVPSRRSGQTPFSLSLPLSFSLPIFLLSFSSLSPTQFPQTQLAGKTPVPDPRRRPVSWTRDGSHVLWTPLGGHN